MGRKGWRALGGRRKGRALVLMYHRVADVEPDPWDLCVSERNFAEHLRVLRAMATCRTVGGLMSALREGVRTPLIAVSFDDGYADNESAAGPKLVEHGVPATFFVVSDTIGAPGEFWWDALGRVFLSPGSLPPRLDLHGRNGSHVWHLGEAAHYDREAARADVSWRADDALPPGPRQKAYLEVWTMLAALDSVERDRLIREILAWAGLGEPARADHAILSETAFAALAAEPLFEIGAHTRTHPSLPDLTVEDQEREMTEGRMALETRLGRPVTSFSYPFGRQTAETREAAKRAGFAVACTSEARAVFPGTDPMAIPRVQVKNWDGRSFRAAVEAYL